MRIIFHLFRQPAVSLHYRMEYLGSECQQWKKRFYFSLLQNDRTSPKAHPTSNSMGAAAPCPELNWPKRDANHLPPCSVEVRKEWRAISVFHLHGLHRANCTFYLCRGIKLYRILYSSNPESNSLSCICL
jgi:hypothetical protein